MKNGTGETVGASVQFAGFVLCSLLAGLSPPAAAQTATEQVFLEELPVVLSASRIPQSLADTPGAVTVLDREFIRATGYRDLPRLLKLVPGINVANDRGHLSYVTYHGLGTDFPNRMQVLIDGRSVYSPYFLGGVDWTGIPITIDEIERIEVLRGSNSTTYGSNAFMGVVNIVTRRAGEEPGSEAIVSAGSGKVRDVGLRHEIRSGDIGLRVNARLDYDQGHSALEDTARIGVLTLRGDYRINNRDELNVWAGWNQTHRGMGFSGNPFNLNGVRSLLTADAFVHLRWRRAVSPGEEIQAGYYHNEDRAVDEGQVYLPPLFPIVPADSNRASTRDNFDFQHLLTPSASTRLAWGMELRRDTIRSKRLFYSAGGASQDLARLFGNLEWRPGTRLTLNAGTMFEHYSGYGGKLAPRLFANWHLAADHTLRAGVTTAYRAPSLLEERADYRYYSDGYSGTLLQYSWVGEPSIRPERMNARELGYIGQFKTWNSALDIRVFREDIRDLIGSAVIVPPLPVFIPPTHVFFNSPDPIHVRGYEWQLKTRPLTGTQLVIGSANLKVDAPSFPQMNFERAAPRTTSTLTWLQKWTDRWSSTATILHYGAYQWGGGSRPEPSYTTLDARIAYRFAMAGKPAEIALVLLNQGRAHEEFLIGSQSLANGNPVPRTVLFTGRFGI